MYVSYGKPPDLVLACAIMRQQLHGAIQDFLFAGLWLTCTAKM